MGHEKMKGFFLSSLLSLFVLISALGLKAAEDYRSEAELLYEQGTIGSYKKCINLYLKALETNPNDYEANWKCSRAYIGYGEEARKQNVEGWKDIGAKYGKEAMKFAQKAIEQEPNKPDGYYYYGLSVGIYSDGVSWFTALKEGLKNKVQKSFEKVYELDKMYENAGAVLALGRYWAVLPWPFRDRKKALKYYREYQATKYFADNEEAQIYLAELLLQLKGKENKKEAKNLLKKVTQSADEHFIQQANFLLSKIK